MTLLARIVAILNRNQIRFALIGAGALAAHGVARSTYDLDLLTTDTRVLHADMWGAISGALVDVRTGAADDPLAGVVRFRMEGARDVDVVVGRPAWQQQVLERARPVKLGDVSIPVVTAYDLILLKLYAGGSQDAWDIEQLLAGDTRAELVREVEERVHLLPVSSVSLWNRIQHT